MNSIRPGARARMSGRRPNVTRKRSSSADFISRGQQKARQFWRVQSESGKPDQPRLRESTERPKLRARFEADRLDRANLHRLLGVRIETIARRPNGQRKCPKADERNFPVPSQAALHRRENRFNGPFRGSLGSAVTENLLHFVD